MKKIFFIILLFVPLLLKAQLPYTWTGANPSWVSTNSGSGSALTWNAGCSSVTTNCVGNYSNNQNTYYTSPTIDASCTNASTINITYTINGNAEFGYDFLFIEYSLNNGTTWINPYGAGVGGTGNTGGTIVVGPVTVPTSATFKFRFNFYSDFSNRASGYKLTDFDIWCNVVMPVELVLFRGSYDRTLFANILKWETASEKNNNFFTLFVSKDGENWIKEYDIKGNGTTSQSSKYWYTHETNSSTYYKLTQTDFDGKVEDLGVVYIPYVKQQSKIIRIINLLGQEISDTDESPRFIYYDDGCVIKKVGK